MKRPAPKASTQKPSSPKPSPRSAEPKPSAPKHEPQPEAVPPPVQASARIGIQVEPTLPGALLNGRHDFLLRGRVISTAPIAEVSLFGEAGRIGQMLFGTAEAPVQLALPDGTAATQHNFVFQMPTPLTTGAARIGFSIVARTDGDQGAQAAFVMDVDPSDPGRGVVASGPRQAGVSDTGTPPTTVLYTERAGIDPDGSLSVIGWVVSREMLVGVQVFVNETRVGSATVGGVREDVAGVHPTYPNARNAGFSLSLPIGRLADQAQSQRVLATTRSGSAIEASLPIELVARQEFLAARQIQPPPPVAAPPQAVPQPEPTSDPRRVIKFYCDEMSLGTDGIVWVRGWAVCATGIAGVSVLLDDRKIGEAEIGQARLDVGDAHPAIPAARSSGFRLRAKALEAASGEHIITIVVRNGLDDVRQHRQRISAQAINRNAETTRSRSVVVAPSAPVQKNFEFKLDTPSLTAGTMTQLVTGRLTIEGWVLARAGIHGIDVLIDEQTVGAAHVGLPRPDIAAAYPDWPEALRCGFAFVFPQHSLRDGDHIVKLRIRAKNGGTHVESLRITVARSVGGPGVAEIRRRIPHAEATLYADMLRRLDWRPQFRVLLRDADARAPDRLAATLASLESQIYPHWRAEVLGDAPALREAVASLVAQGRIGAARVGFFNASLASLADAPDAAASLVGVLRCGDQLGCDALATFAVQSGINRTAELLYADEVRDNPATGQREAFFKAGFSPDLLLSTNYIGRPWFAAPALLDRAGIAPASLARLGAYDLILRCTEQAAAGGVIAIASLLCERADGEDETAASETKALADAAKRRGSTAAVEPGCLPGIWRLQRSLVTKGKVSVIIPTSGAGDRIKTCLATLKKATGYRNLEIVAIDNIPAGRAKDKAWLRKTADKVVPGTEAFNWSLFNNRAAAAADGEFLLFLNDDIEVAERGWLDAMLEHAQRPEIGVVGPRLLYPDGKVQHAGMFLAGGSTAKMAFRFAEADEPGYFGLARTQRNVIAVTGACMLMRRETFAALGGFDEAHDVVNGDVDFCLRAHKLGLLTVYTPHATLTHHEQASRAQPKSTGDQGRFDRNWRIRLAEGDPYFSPNLSRQFADYRPNDEAIRAVVSGHPLFRVDDVRRILAVKVDDVGDFVAALPAIRRLKAHFPQARITVLANPAARRFAALDPAIEDSIDFDFIHGRYATGRREADPEELASLAARLAPFAFDLAIDLHKRPDTRPLLRCSGAPILAGFDYLGRFPWLDVALEWEGDRRLQPKRATVGDDLLHLVDAVATAAQDDRTGIRPGAVAALRASPGVPEDARKFLAANTVVCVQAGAASPIKQWPVGHFAALIDLLISRNQVGVVLVGGPEEAELSARLLAAVAHGDRVLSLVGTLAPEFVPSVIAGCALFVGNDGGLLQVAAALGIPTVGVHSATSDPVERAPTGAAAVAVARSMTCSPCYLTRIEDCPRGFACMRELDPSAVHRVCETMLARQLPLAVAPAPAEEVLDVAPPVKKAPRPRKALSRSRERVG
jgi:ADP-heptose:LPS heptosyltransferase/GT2 family glycosyltransferase